MTMRWRPAGVAAAILLPWLAGCGSPEPFRRPDSPIPTDWPATTEASDATPLARDIRWQEFYRDPDLQALIRAGLGHNRDLRIALARVAEARSQLAIVRADQMPSVALSATSLASETPANVTANNTPFSLRRNDLSLTVVSYELDFWGRVGSLSSAAAEAALASEAGRRSLTISVITEIAAAYYAGIELRERTANAEAVITIRRRTMELTRRSLELGAAAQSDVLLAKSLVSGAEAELAILHQQSAATRHTLDLLTGFQSSGLPAGRRLADLEVLRDIAPGLASDVLFSRPDVIAAEHRLRETRANIAAARAAFFPRIVLTATLGLASRGIGSLFAAGSNSWLFQPALSKPIFDGGRTAGLLDAATSREATALADYEKTIQQAFREVADLLAARASLIKQREAAEATVQAMGQRERMAEIRYRSGSGTLLEVLEAQRELFGARQSLLLLQRAQLTTATQLYKALGGGSAVIEDSGQAPGKAPGS